MVTNPLSLILGIDYRPGGLVRARETRSQVGLTAKERKQNFQNAFKGVRDKVEDSTILLVDDVSTTGATLSSAADALDSAGAKEVYAVTIARALPHHSLNFV
jgi:predicted amidophosphoribosyltransferase